MVRKIFILGMLLAFAACGASSRTKALRVSLVSVTTTRDTVVKVSHERATQIIDAATSKEDGRAKLDAWREQVDAALKALDVAQDAIFTAALLNDAKSASEAGAAVVRALALAKEVMK